MILAASSWSGSSQYLLANTRQASAVSIYKTHRRLYSSVSIVLWQTIPLTMKNSSHSLFISSLLQIQYFNQWSGYNWPLLIRCIWIPISTCMFSLTPYFMTVMYNYLNKQESRMHLDQSNMFIFMLYKFCQWTTGTILLSDKHLIVFQNWMIVLLYIANSPFMYLDHIDFNQKSIIISIKTCWFCMITMTYATYHSAEKSQ